MTVFPVGSGMTSNFSSRYLELAEDAEELGEGSRYRSNETVREPWNMMFHDFLGFKYFVFLLPSLAR